MENKLKAPEGYTFKAISETEIELQPIEKKYPTNIEDIERHCALHCDFNVNYWSDEINQFSSKETALKFAAMIQLVEFRDAWNKIDGFVADWGNYSQMKMFIGKKRRFYIDYCYSFSRPLHFGSKETAEKFLKQFEPLIIQAGDLV